MKTWYIDFILHSKTQGFDQAWTHNDQTRNTILNMSVKNTVYRYNCKARLKTQFGMDATKTNEGNTNEPRKDVSKSFQQRFC